MDRNVDAPMDRGRDAAPDVAPDLVPDAAEDAPPDPFSGYHWTVLPAPLGASISAIALDSEGALYAGGGGSPSGGAGIFRSTDEGASWRPASLGLLAYDVVGLAAVGTTMYAASAGLLRSTDRGASWQVKFIAPELFHNVSGQGDLVVAGTAAGNPLYVSTDAGNTFHQLPSPPGGLVSLEVLAAGSVIVRAGDRGVFRSTDLGVTFNPVPGISNGPQLFAQLRCDGASTCYANAYPTPDPSSAPVLLKSTDAGATWTPLSSMGSDVRVLAISDTGSVYLKTGLGNARSDDGGSTFAPIPRPATARASAPDCDGAYAARGDQLFAGCRDGVYRSADKGQHWLPASGSPTTGAITGAAVRLFVDTSPTALGPDGDIYVNGTDGIDERQALVYSLRRSSDGGQTWQTLASPFAWGPCVVTPAGALECRTVEVSSMRFTLGRSEDHGATWRNVDVPAGLVSFLGDVGLAASGSIVYLTGDAGVARSTDDGLTFQVLPGGPALGDLQALRNGHLLAMVPLLDNGYRSTDQGATWQLTAGLHALPLPEDPSGRLFRFDGVGSVDVSTDEATTWTPLSSSGVAYRPGVPLPLLIDGPGHLFWLGWASSSNDDPVRIFGSTDGGVVFLPLPAQIPNFFALSSALDKRGRLLVGTAGGIFRLEPAADPR